MSEPWPDIGHTYDVAAEHYAATFAGELDGKPFDRDLLDRYAAALAGRGEVWDVGCGAAGHLTRYLADRGVAASGADLSPGSVAVARECQPGLTIRVADMCDLPDSTCGRRRRLRGEPGRAGQVARTKPAITVPSRSPASSCRKCPAFSMTG